MSGTTATARPLRSRPATTKSRPRLIVVASPRAAGKAPFVALVGALLLAGLLSLLMLHTLAAQDSFRQTALQQRLASLTDTEQRLEQQVQLDSAPSALRKRAKALGMVPSVITHYRQLPNGRTVAHEVAAPVYTAPIVTTTTTDTTAATHAGTGVTATHDATGSETTKSAGAAQSDNTKSDNAKSHHEKSQNVESHGDHGAPRR